MGVPPSEGALLLPPSPPGMPTGRLLAPERSSESPVRKSAMLLSAAAEGDVPGEPKNGGHSVFQTCLYGSRSSILGLIPILIRIQDFDDQKLKKKITAEFFFSKLNLMQKNR